jgi:hypothetical protein
MKLFPNRSLRYLHTKAVEPSIAYTFMYSAPEWIRNAQKRCALALLVLFFWTIYSPTLLMASTIDSKNHLQARAEPKNKVRKGPRGLIRLEPKVSFSANVSDAELINARVFIDPLAPMHSPVVSGENTALAKALAAYKAKRDPGNVDDLKAFLKLFPMSRWRPALELNIAHARYDSGYFSEALNDCK